MQPPEPTPRTPPGPSRRQVTDADFAGRYHVRGLLGAGAMAEVYLAEHAHIGRLEAIKVLNRHTAEKRALVDRFRQEARIINRLSHRNIVSVYDFGALTDGRLYLAMEYAEGEDLESVVKRSGAIPHDACVRILGEIASAVAHAHARDVIHRDLKPQNIVLVERAGSEEVKVLDFGFARIISSGQKQARVTRTGETLGTPLYMSPEQFRGQLDDHRIDIYAFGCIAYELLVGTPLFAECCGWGPLAYAHMQRPVTPMREAAPETRISDELEAVVMRCLQKDPNQRYGSMDRVALALAGVPVAKGGSLRLTMRTSSRAGFGPGTPPIAGSSPQAAAIADDRAEASPIPEGVQTLVDMKKPVLAPAPASPRIDPTAREATVREVATQVHERTRDTMIAAGLQRCQVLESTRETLESQGKGLADRRATIEVEAHEKEAALRFAVGELRFSRDQAIKDGEPVDRDIDYQIEALEKRLRVVAAENDRALEPIVDEEIDCVAQLAINEEERASAHVALHKRLAQVAKNHVGDGTIQQLFRGLEEAPLPGVDA